MEMGKGFQDVEQRRRIFRTLSDNSIEVRRDFLEAWSQALGSYIIDEEKPKLERLSDEMWVLNAGGIGRAYIDGIGFVPTQLADEYSDVLKPPERPVFG